MFPLNVKSVLKSAKKIELPSCSFFGCRCGECIHFRLDEKIDANGKARCDYKGRWYYPSEGCGSGITRREYFDDQNRKLAEEQKQRAKDYAETQETYKATIESDRRIHKSTQNMRTSSAGNDGSLMAPIFLVLLIGTISANLFGLEVTFSNQGSIDNNDITAYEMITLNQENYKTKNIRFRDSTTVRLKIGEYDCWTRKDNVSGYAGESKVSGILNVRTKVSTDNNASVDYYILYLQIQNSKKLPLSNLPLDITDKYGTSCVSTPYGEDGSYVVRIPESAIENGSIGLTLCTDGYKQSELQLQIKNDRVITQKLTLSTQ